MAHVYMLNIYYVIYHINRGSHETEKVFDMIIYDTILPSDWKKIYYIGIYCNCQKPYRRILFRLIMSIDQFYQFYWLIISLRISVILQFKNKCEHSACTSRRFNKGHTVLRKHFSTSYQLRNDSLLQMLYFERALRWSCRSYF